MVGGWEVNIVSALSQRKRVETERERAWQTLRKINSCRCKTVLYTINRKPIICENPFRKVFAKRKEFYQSREDRDKVSPETSSKKLIWRHSNHNCRRLSKCEQPYMAPAASPIVQDSLSNLDSRNLPETNPKFFTLNANIEPFDPFIIKHDISRGLDPNR